MVFLIAALHGVFVFVVGAATRNQTALNAATVIAIVVAIVVGDSSYAIGDLIAVGLAYVFADDLIEKRAKTQAVPHEKAAPRLDAPVEVLAPEAATVASMESQEGEQAADEAPLPEGDDLPISIRTTPAYPGFVIRRAGNEHFWVYYSADQLAVARSVGNFALLRDCVRSVELMKWCARFPVHEADWNPKAPELLRPLTQS